MTKTAIYHWGGMHRSLTGHDEIQEAVRLACLRGERELRSMRFENFEVESVNIIGGFPRQEEFGGCLYFEVSGIDQDELDRRKSVADNSAMIRWFPDESVLEKIFFEGGCWWLEGGKLHVNIDKTSPKIEKLLEIAFPEEEVRNEDPSGSDPAGHVVVELEPVTQEELDKV